MHKLLSLIFIVLIMSELSGQNCVRGNCVNGFGTITFSNNARYTGEFRGGKMEGRGLFYYSNGNKYIGQWKGGLRHGEGKLVKKDGNIYTGNFINDKIQGQGTMNYSSGDRYVGQWNKEQVNGKGNYYFKNGDRYEGNFLNGQFEGEGSFFYSDGSNYKGSWKASQRSGYGEYNDGKGKTYSGQWLADKAVKVIVDDLADLEEEEEKDTVVTKPVVKEEGKVNVVQVCDEKLPNCNTSFCKSGRGILDYADGSKYVGEFVNGDPKGKGICYYANGDRYEGYWDNHAPHGEGTMFFKSGLVYGAMWNHGQSTKQLLSKQEFVFNDKIQVDKNKEVKIWSVIVGISKYEHMPSLKYADDDAYRIYAFLKSPEGGALPDNQIKILVDEDATRNNILKAMNELFMRADENDVVMLYYSGHGLEGTFIPIDYDGFDHALQHDEVKEMFNKSKAKHKVCYADACHSGSLLAAKSPFSSSLMYFYEDLDKASGGTAFMMSSKSKEYSLEDGGLRQGIFSHFLIRGLKGEADKDHNLTITISELFNYVYSNVRDYTGQAQTPLIAGDYNEQMPVGFCRVEK